MTLISTSPTAAPAILVTGGTGFIGRALIAALLRDGLPVIVLARDPRRARSVLGSSVAIVERLDAILPSTRIDSIVNLAGARVLGPPWTAARRRTLLHSRTTVTAAVVELIARLSITPSVLVSASAIGYYGAAPPGSRADCDEASPPHPGEFQSDLCAAIETEALRAEAIGVRVVRTRSGVVLGSGDGAYPPQALSARLGLAAVLGSGRQFAPWIHLDDAIGLIRFALMQRDLGGALNVVAPESVTQRQFVTALAASYGRRARLHMPAAPIRLLAGEMSTLLLDGQSVVPRRALDCGYSFRFATLRAALADLAAPNSTPGR